MQPPGPVLAPELADEVLVPGDALRRQVGVQQEGPPDEVRRHVRPGMEHPAQPPDAATLRLGFATGPRRETDENIVAQLRAALDQGEQA